MHIMLNIKSEWKGIKKGAIGCFLVYSIYYGNEGASSSGNDVDCSAVAILEAERAGSHSTGV
jgi:hypothetical protein